MPIDVIKPHVFEELGQIEAFFTLKNEGLGPDVSRVSGLNLGFNTDEAPEVVRQNRERLLAEYDIDPDWIAFANQVHSNRVKVVTDGGTFAETDGLITQVPGLALAIQVADCAAVLIGDTESKTVAAVHAGWRGAAGDIIPRVCNKMNEMDVNLESCRAFISPCISLKNFEVGPEVAVQFPDVFVDYENYEKPHLDLKSFLAKQLSNAGLKSENIEIHPDCTIDDQQYYSYRRGRGKAGRMMGVIRIKGDEL